MTWLLRTLRAQKTGIFCAGAVTLLLGFGSIWMNVLPEHYRDLYGDDLRFFIDPPRLIHFWLYGLAAVLALWALSAAVCTWDSLLSRLRRRVLRPSAYGAPLLHISFVAALILHLWGGLSSQETQHQVTEGGTAIHGAQYKLLDFHHEAWPSGMPKVVEARLHRAGRGEGEELTLGYNDPIVLHGGATVLLLGGMGQGIRGVFVHGAQKAEMEPGQVSNIDGLRVWVHDIVYRRGMRVPVADVSIGEGAGQRLMLGLGAPAELGVAFADGRAVRAVEIKERHNPSFPWTLAFSGLVALGALLVGWERLRR